MHGQPKSIDKPKKTIREQVAIETEKMLSLARRVRRRLDYHLHKTADTRSVPGEDFAEMARFVQKTIESLNRFVAQPTAKPDEKSQLTDAEFAAEARLIAIEVLRDATADERQRLLDEADSDPPAPSGVNPARFRNFT